jgi:hypothetical protein
MVSKASVVHCPSLMDGLPQLRDAGSLGGEAHWVVVMHWGTELTISKKKRATVNGSEQVRSRDQPEKDPDISSSVI